MARVAIHAPCSNTADALSDILKRAGHEVVFMTAADNGEGAPDPRTDPAPDPSMELIDLEPDLVVADLLVEDARSVKIMQTVQAQRPFVQFLFLLDEKTGREHMVMAMNEGAAALVTLPVEETVIKHYVGRTLNASRERKKQAEELARCEQLIEKEKTCSLEQARSLTEHRQRDRLFHRLINRLLAISVKSGRVHATVLLVSDSSYQLDLFRPALEELNFHVETAGDGALGLARAREIKPKIIVSDLEMPGLNGLEFCRAVKNDETLAPNYFIICTANQNKIEEVLQPENKVDDCLIKPSRKEEFSEFTARVALGLMV